MNVSKRLILFGVASLVTLLICGLVMIATGLATSMLFLVAAENPTPQLRMRLTRVIPPTPVAAASIMETPATDTPSAVPSEASSVEPTASSATEVVADSSEVVTESPTTDSAINQTNPTTPLPAENTPVETPTTTPISSEAVVNAEPTATSPPANQPATATPLVTPSPTNTPQPGATQTPTPRPTATPTSTPQPTATFTPRADATATPTPEPGSTNTATPTDTPTPTNTPSPTATATDQPQAGQIRGRILVDGQPASGVRLQLENQDYNVVNQTTTGGEGRYQFTDLAASSAGYNVLFTLEANSQYQVDQVVNWGWLGPVAVSDGDTIELADFDISLRGLKLTNPSPNATFSAGDISPVNPVEFKWDSYAQANAYWVDLSFGEAMALVWQSSLVDGTSVEFDGRLSNGSQIEAGNYWWGVGVERDLGDYTLTVYGYSPPLKIRP